ncbi:hypothetical protein ZIOFF_075690 [Zingiber officinale]|uniref:Uncharacterized protein n=1 Tax=Zingiber officinale TaxID=94328 RepID=A0A8J5BWU0_ZINOF|nr:hypothetical protein ZIOFF_075690 [Zingiber officinale]
MEEGAKMEKDLSSAAAFVEGGIQDACDDACSICLEEFCQSDPSTELLDAVIRERNIRLNKTQTTTIFHHPALGDFELQHLPGDGSEAEFEERLMQHLAAAAAMGRVHHISRREGHLGRSGFHHHPQFLIFSPHPNAPYVGYRNQHKSHNQQYLHITYASQSAPVLQDRPGPSDIQSFSESVRSRLNAVSMRYKESITKSTRGWGERLFSRSGMVNHLATRDNIGSAFSSPVAVNSAAISNNEGVTGNHVVSLPTDTSAPCLPVSSAN